MTFTAILDTSFLYALTDRKDRNHEKVVRYSQRIRNDIALPVTVLPEICYLIGSRLGHQPMRFFLGQLFNSDVNLLSITRKDLDRTSEILDEYADSRLDFVDATIAALAERFNITCVLTLDRRDFSIMRPRHCTYFEIGP